MARLAVRSLFIALVTLVMIEGVGTESETLESLPRPIPSGINTPMKHACEVCLHFGFVFSRYSIPTGPELATADVTSASGGEVYIQVSKH